MVRLFFLIDIILQLFNAMISPILLYGSEVRGYEIMIAFGIVKISLLRKCSAMYNVMLIHEPIKHENVTK